jgi:hypothetical protein
MPSACPFTSAARVGQSIFGYATHAGRRGEVLFAGRFFAFAGMHVSPKPLHQPHSPIWVSGSSDARCAEPQHLARCGCQHLRRSPTWSNAWLRYTKPAT